MMETEVTVMRSLCQKMLADCRRWKRQGENSPLEAKEGHSSLYT